MGYWKGFTTTLTASVLNKCGKNGGKRMAFNNYLEDENDKPYFTTNSLAYYYDKMEGFAKAVEGSAKELNLTKEEIEQRIALRLAEWDKNLETFDGSVEKLLTEWVDDGTLTHVIDSTLIDQKIAPVTAEIKQNLKSGSNMYKVSKIGNINYSKRKPTFTIQDDDTQNELYSKLFPIAKEYNIPISAALISSRVGQVVSTITMPQFYEMRDSGLVEFCNHTHTHQNLTNLTPEQAEEEIRLCEEWLESHGVGGTKHLVYPFGGQNTTVQHIASKYVHSASRSNNHLIDPAGGTISSFALNRIIMEADIELIKSKIDEAVLKNGWIILNVHAHYPEFSEAKLREVIEYALNAGMKFDNFSNPFKDFANVVEVQDFTGTTPSGLLGVISASGRRTGIFGTDSSGLTIKELDPTNIKSDMLPTDYPENTISTSRFTKAMGEANGWGEGGILFTDNRGGNAYAYQLFHGIGKTGIKKRAWNLGTSSWFPFSEIGATVPIADNNSKIITTQAYTIPAMGRQSITIPVIGVTPTDSIVINPITVISSFFMYTVQASPTTGNIALRLFNFSDVERIIDIADWRVRWIKNI